jgi:sec-independent protein translocase protein TatA
MPSHFIGPVGIVIVVLIILLFAAPKLPVLAKSIAQSLNIFKTEVGKKDDPAAKKESGEPRTEGTSSTADEPKS